MPVIDKWNEDVLAVVDQIPDGATIAVGGFGRSGAPRTLCDALCDLGKKELTIVSNNAGVDPTGVGRIAQEGRLRKFIGSFPSNSVFTEQLMTGKAEVEILPQGTLVERVRAAGAGIAAFYTPTSAGTMLADGTYPSKYDAEGRPIEYMAPKEQREFDGRLHVLELALPVDFALVKAHRADRLGNLVFHLSARNFNASFATGGRVSIVETENFVAVGDIAPDDVMLPGIFIDHVVPSNPEAQ